MPHRNHLETVLSDAVVNLIADAFDMKAPHPRGTGFLYGSADVRLTQEQIENVLKVLANGTWCRWPVGGPPTYDAFDLARRPAGDVQLKGQRYS
jgi:hypothetical protein